MDYSSLLNGGGGGSAHSTSSAYTGGTVNLGGTSFGNTGGGVSNQTLMIAMGIAGLLGAIFLLR